MVKNIQKHWTKHLCKILLEDIINILTKMSTSNVNHHGNICVNAEQHIAEDVQR